jgi:hypothetical protein
VSAGPRDEYPDDLTLRDARARYFAANGFGGDGGYAKKVEVVKLGPIPILIPNVAGRVAALQYHDLHHVLTGYRTDLSGEFEIAAFELAAGCGRLWFAWLINLSGLPAALLLPHRAARAWARGRRSGGLYRGRVDDALLDRTVGEVRDRLRLRDEPEPTARDWLGLLATTAVGMLVGGAIYLGPLAAIVALVWWVLAG